MKRYITHTINERRTSDKFKFIRYVRFSIIIIEFIIFHRDKIEVYNKHHKRLFQHLLDRPNDAKHDLMIISYYSY